MDNYSSVVMETKHRVISDRHSENGLHVYTCSGEVLAGFLFLSIDLSAFNWGILKNRFA